MRKRIFTSIFTITFFLSVFAQDKADSFRQILRVSKEDTVKANALIGLSDFYTDVKTDSTYYFASQLLLLSQKLRYAKGIYTAYYYLSYIYGAKGNYPQAVDMMIQGLRLAEQANDEIGMENCNRMLGFLANAQGNYKDAFSYMAKSVALGEKNNYKKGLSRSYYNLGGMYQKMNLPDSALVNLEKAYRLARGTGDKKPLSGILGRLGDVHLMMGDKELAYTYYKMGLKTSREINNNIGMSYGYYSLADYFNRFGQVDSSIYYARLSLEKSMETDFKPNLLRSSRLLSKTFKSKGTTDSAFKYLDIAMTTRDSLESSEKLQQLQNINVQEKLRQQQIAEVKLKAEEERKHNLQYAGIAVGLITFIIMFVALSRTIVVKEKFIEFFGVLGLLAVFEFINLFIHPYLAHATNHSPVLMLLVLIAIGALLVPLHHKLEKWMTRIMVEKNKKIRLEAAKKTIAKLEGEQAN